MFADDGAKSELLFKERLMLTILSGLMLRHAENGYSDEYAMEEAYRLAESWCSGSLPGIAGASEPKDTHISFRCPVCGRYTSAILPEMKFDPGDMVATSASVFCSNDKCMQEFEFGVAR